MVRKSIDYEVKKVQLNPSGGELLGLLGIVLGAKQGAISYIKQVEGQF